MGRAREIPSSAPKQQVPQQQTYIVDDATGASEQTTEDEMKQFEEQAPKEMPKEELQIDKRLEDLLFLGKITKEIEILGHKFKISTLSHREHNDIVKQLYKFGDSADLFTIRVITLANVLKTVDDTPLSEMQATGDFESEFSKRSFIIDGMQLGVVERLYDEYNKLLKESDTLVSGEVIKKS
jgi:hypothetical protein